MNGTMEQELLRSGRIVCPNRGRSMLPLLRENRDLMVIERRGPERMKKYEAILYRRGQRYVLHRIVRVRERDYFVVGDNDRRGEYVKDEQILGRLTQVLRDGKTLPAGAESCPLWLRLWCDLYPLRVGILFLRDAAVSLRRRIRALGNRDGL